MADDRTVDGYIAALGAPRDEIARRLRTAVRFAAPDAKELVKYGHEVYEAWWAVRGAQGLPEL